MSARALRRRPALGLLAFLASACATVATHEGPVEAIRADARYDALFPYYVELCAVSQIRSHFAPHGGSPGHAAMYVKGACRDDATEFPTLRVCDDRVDLSDPESGTGVSVNKLLRNVNWMATPGKALFYYGNLGPDEVLNRDTALAAIYGAEAAGVFSGVEAHGSYLPPEGDEEALLYLTAAETLGTDFALNFGRTVYCARLPLERRQLEDVIGFLNDLNKDYARGGRDYSWSGFNDNCSHTLHNSLAAAGVWKAKTIASFRLGQFANLSVPANEFADLALLITSYPVDDFEAVLGDPVLRTTLARRSWLPTRHGALVQIIPVHQNNELYETDVAIFMLTHPFHRGKSLDVRDLFDVPEFTDLEANLLHFQELYGKVLAERPEDWDVDTSGDARSTARAHYYRYIQAQLEDVNAKLRRLRSLPNP
ncbi:MAG: hypothetical protein QNK04_23715 [Myxococcota bacterium]|nr:hypothetical protein [Myxococcota bacterium]